MIQKLAAIGLFFPTFLISADLAATVLDSTGGSIPAASWVLLSRDRSAVECGTTDAIGQVLVKAPNGTYILRVTVPGMENLERVVTVGPTSAPLMIVADPATVRSTVTVTASASATEDVHNAAQSVNVITNETLRRRVKSVIAQLALEEEGIAPQRTSAGLAGVFVRGQTGSRNSVYVDDVRFSNSAARGGVSTYFSVLDPGMIDIIEVVRGPAADRYGSDSMGGSIQLFSPEPHPENAPLQPSGLRSAGPPMRVLERASRPPAARDVWMPCSRCTRRASTACAQAAARIRMPPSLVFSVCPRACWSLRDCRERLPQRSAAFSGRASAPQNGRVSLLIMPAAIATAGSGATSCLAATET
jgi:hypothetical protein